jgi:hypothetical protein
MEVESHDTENRKDREEVAEDADDLGDPQAANRANLQDFAERKRGVWRSVGHSTASFFVES